MSNYCLSDLYFNYKNGPLFVYMWKRRIWERNKHLKSVQLQCLSAMKYRNSKVCRDLLKLISGKQFAMAFETSLQRNVPLSATRRISTCCSNLKLHHIQPKAVSSPQHAELFVASLRTSDRVLLEEALMKYNSTNKGLRFIPMC